MEPRQPNRTALAAAAHRAAHQLLERGAIFSDPLAVRILGGNGDEEIRRVSADPQTKGLRLFIAVRTRCAEDALDAAIARGVRQVLVLGAGLDTYAYRHAADLKLRMFEVDHPATQAWKRKRLAEVAIPVPPTPTFAPIDFEGEALGPGLERAGFDPDQRTFVMWLGVVPYLTERAVLATLRYFAKLSGGAEVIFDYANPPTEGARDERAAAHEALAARVASVGEPFKTYFDTAQLLRTLTSLGFSNLEDRGPAEITAQYFPNQPRRPSNIGGHIVRAATS